MNRTFCILDSTNFCCINEQVRARTKKIKYNFSFELTSFFLRSEYPRFFFFFSFSADRNWKAIGQIVSEIRAVVKIEEK